jgi:hypothetical protein
MKSNKKSFGLVGALGFVLAAATLSHGAVGDTIRVNCGGPAYVSAAGKQWAADSGFSGGQTYSATDAIANTADPALHQDERWDSSPFSYTFYVANAGSYRVSLYEASLYSGVCNSGGRRFNVAINGVTVLTDYDMFDDIGACLTAKTLNFLTTVTSNKQVKIDFTLGSASNPKINAIEVMPATSAGVIDAPKTVSSRFSVAGSNGSLRVQSNVEGTYSLELSDLQGRLISRKHGFGQASQTFANLNPGLYFLTSRAGDQVSTQKVSVVR